MCSFRFGYTAGSTRGQNTHARLQRPDRLNSMSAKSGGIPGAGATKKSSMSPPLRGMLMSIGWSPGGLSMDLQHGLERAPLAEPLPRVRVPLERKRRFGEEGVERKLGQEPQ